MRRTKAAAGVVGAVSVVVLGGCAGNQPAAMAGIDDAEARIDEAERAEAQQYANRELNMAREKLIAAREAQQEGDEERAARLAERAELDASLAIATSDNESIQSAVDELRMTIATLESELERQSEDSDLGSPRDESPEAAPSAPPADTEADAPDTR